MTFHPSGTAIATALSNGTVLVYDLIANKIRQNYVLHDNATSIAWHPNGNFFLCCGTDSTLRVVDVMEGHPVYTLKSHTGTVNSVAFSRDGSFFASGGADKHVMVITFTRKIISTLALFILKLQYIILPSVASQPSDFTYSFIKYCR